MLYTDHLGMLNMHYTYDERKLNMYIIVLNVVHGSPW